MPSISSSPASGRAGILASRRVHVYPLTDLLYCIHRRLTSRREINLDSQLFGEDLVDELTTGAPTDEKRNARARTILKAPELEEYAEQHPATLSGGQKQRLALGVALMHDAPIIILDEPTSGLDGANMRNVSQIIRKLAGMGRTILVITHDAECALSCCDRAIRLENGAITDDFPIHSVDILLDKIGYQSCGQRGVCYSGT